MKQYNIELAPHALYQLEKHIEFLAQATHAGAARTKKDVFAEIATLNTMPERHPYMDDEALPKNCFHKFLTCK